MKARAYLIGNKIHLKLPETEELLVDDDIINDIFTIKKVGEEIELVINESIYTMLANKIKYKKRRQTILSKGPPNPCGRPKKTITVDVAL